MTSPYTCRTSCNSSPGYASFDSHLYGKPAVAYALSRLHGCVACLHKLRTRPASRSKHALNEQGVLLLRHNHLPQAVCPLGSCSKDQQISARASTTTATLPRLWAAGVRSWWAKANSRQYNAPICTAVCVDPSITSAKASLDMTTSTTALFILLLAVRWWKTQVNIPAAWMVWS